MFNIRSSTVQSLCILVSLLVTSLLSACQPIQAPTPAQTLVASKGLRPDAPSYAMHGPFWVGYRPLISGEGTAQPLEISLWYPALNPTRAKEAIRYNVKIKDATWSPDTPPVVYGRALRNAAFDRAKGPYPLVIFSHGFSESAANYSTLVEHYASYGFVVLAPEHTEQFDLSLGDLWKALIDRPGDVKQTIDYAEALTAPDGDMAGLIDMAHVAVIGHSYGGYTALAMAGAQYDLVAYNARCSQLAETDALAFFCTPIGPSEAKIAARAGLDAMPPGCGHRSVIPG